MDRRPIKTCGCGRSYSASAWAELPACGEFSEYDDLGIKLEQRLCVCRSHLVVAKRDGTYLTDDEFNTAVDSGGG